MRTHGGMSWYLKSVFILLGVFFIESIAVPADAIPVFARRYKISCMACHVGFPKLNAFGESFAGNGYRMQGEDLSKQEVDTGDEKLQLLDHLPLAIRADSFFRTRNDTTTSSDLQAPFTIKLLSSAPITKNVSYYFYFLFNERGDVAGVEDAFIYFNDGFKNVDLDLRVGQFQVSDILFAREQRLTFQDFQYFVTAVSNSGFQLTYDRAAEVSYSFDVSDGVSMGIVTAIANGNGIGLADSERNFDSDNFKNFYGLVSLDVGDQSVGLYGYSGRERNNQSVNNEFFRVGPKFEFNLSGDLGLWGSVLYGEDSNPTFSLSNGRRIESWGALVGATYTINEDVIGSLLYNRAQVNENRALDAHTVTANLSYFMARNFKLMLEFTGDLETVRSTHTEKEHTGVLGLVLAF
ncbi:MAG: hypothetical protein G3M78_00480 [Candidatus Nitrohelix vancouverensis]|uniref:Uncharacterized protein n=1 Tax=Candidatus Nitrohelix vancouverensis TaxID=2705534 RepID=A0A7T0G281_9BACT|nr:MAG: hypothetical protein G3M78_00480 [Candidatus Nitrohelix vancouverensis]